MATGSDIDTTGKDYIYKPRIVAILRELWVGDLWD